MVLAAGRGTRLGDVSLTTPKILVDICGEPLLARQLTYLERQGADHVVVNAFHLSQQVRAFAAAYTGPLRLTVSSEPTLLGTAGGVRRALEALGPHPFVVLYGDVITDEPLAPIAMAHRRSGAAVTLAVYESDDVAGKGLVMTDSNGYVKRFVEKDPDAVGPALINAGLYVVDPAPLSEWKAGTSFEFGFDYFPWLLERGDSIFTYQLAAPVVDVGTPAGLTAGRKRFGG